LRLWLIVVSLLGILHADSLRVPLGLDTYVPAPENNPLTRESVELGRALFFWPGLSRDRTLSCAGCHVPAKAFSDARKLAIGVNHQVGSRRTPRILNRAWGTSFFWDGRATTLEDQVLQPIVNPIEMGLRLEEIAPRVRADAELSARMRAVFGHDAGAVAVARALASYIRSILAGDSPYDQFVAGRTDALTERQRAGLKLFRGKANCVACHLGPHLTDELFHNTGTAWRDGMSTDPGRAAVSRDEADRGAFKTPGLREVARAGPYMHDGGLPTLEAVIDYYDRGARQDPGLDSEIRPLHLSSEEKHSLVEFLKSLTGKVSEGWPGSP
jgi:cytochrome c peroxidase